MAKRMRMIFLVAVASLCAGAAQAVPIIYKASLSGPAESPPVASPGTGLAVVGYDPIAHTLSIDVVFDDLIGNTTVSHIHCCTAIPLTGTAGVATTTPTFPGFPAGVTSGSYSQLFDLTLLSSFNAPFVTNNGGTAATAEAALAAGLDTGRAYFNIHTNFAPGGEIRGFLAVPEPASLALLGLGFTVLLASRRTRAG